MCGGRVKAMVYATSVNTEQELWQHAQNACQIPERSPSVLESYSAMCGDPSFGHLFLKKDAYLLGDKYFKRILFCLLVAIYREKRNMDLEFL
jgi:hypothetical protein